MYKQKVGISCYAETMGGVRVRLKERLAQERFGSHAVKEMG